MVHSAYVVPVLLVLAVAPSCWCSSGILTKGTQLVDELGRVVTLRGLNLPINGKTPNFMPLMNKTGLETLQLYGTSVARVPFTWEAYEPERGQFNTEYLQYYQGIVEALHELGILSIIDLHQDSYSRFLNKGCGDGFPKWSVLVEEVLEKPPLNGVTCIAWILTANFDLVGQQAWKAFFAGQGGVRDAFLGLSETLAETFAGNPAVLGYDLLNEPYGDEVTEIAPLYEDIAVRIRKHDSSAILFVQPQMTAAGGGAINLPKPSFANFALATHYYNYVGNISLAGLFVPFQQALPDWLNLTASWDAPLFFGEFGAKNDPVKAPPYIDMFYNALDATLLSGLQWGWTNGYSPVTKDGWNQEDYSVVDQNLAMRSNYAIRPYPRAVAGIPISFQVDAGAKSVSLSWEVVGATLAAGAASGGQGATTVVFAPLQGFFGASSAAQLRILVSPAEAAIDCTYASGGLFFSCTVFQTGTFTVVLQPAA